MHNYDIAASHGDASVALFRRFRRHCEALVHVGALVNHFVTAAADQAEAATLILSGEPGPAGP
jgi:hypothetical protein